MFSSESQLKTRQVTSRTSPYVGPELVQLYVTCKKLGCRKDRVSCEHFSNAGCFFCLQYDSLGSLTRSLQVTVWVVHLLSVFHYQHDDLFCIANIVVARKF